MLAKLKKKKKNLEENEDNNDVDETIRGLTIKSIERKC